MRFPHSTWAACMLATLAFGWALAAEGGNKAEGSGPQKLKVALDGNCAVCAIGGKTVKGKPEFKSTFQGLEYYFPSKEIKEKFDAEPERFAAQNMGYCNVCSVDMHQQVKGNPAIYAIHDSKIYLFANQDAKKKFEENPSRYAGGEPKKNEGSGQRVPRREGS